MAGLDSMRRRLRLQPVATTSVSPECASGPNCWAVRLRCGVRPAPEPRSARAGHLWTSRHMTDPIRVVVADDHPLFREGVINSLRSSGDISVVGEAVDADSAVRVV